MHIHNDGPSCSLLRIIFALGPFISMSSLLLRLSLSLRLVLLAHHGIEYAEN
jgi:hypothetical protein